MDYAKEYVNEFPISTDRIFELLLEEDHYFKLLKCLFKDSRLSYDKNYLAFNDERVSQFLELFCPYEYEETMERLREEK